MSIFRETINSTISTQIEKRQNAMTKRSTGDIQYLNSRNAWIRMSSSVDINNTNNDAVSNVLLGGTLLNNATLRSGIGVGGAYTPTRRLGIRPMPGITGVEIKSKSAYGSLREAVVSFQCWDISQLETLELLYMRPGYTVLLEWGWTPYLDNNGSLITKVPAFYDILNKGATPRTQIFKELYDKCTDANGNYDAVYGYIKNYQWSARPDGGYDCQTTLITTGEIIESLKVNYVRGDLANYEMYDINGKPGNGFLTELFTNNGTVPPMTLSRFYEKNTLAGIWAELYFKTKNIPSTGKYSTIGYTIPMSEWWPNPLGWPGLNEGEENQFIVPGDNFPVYVRLDTVVGMLNRYIIAKGSDGTPNGEPLVTLSLTTPSYSGKTSINCQCVANQYSISTNPGVCLIKNTNWDKILSDLAQKAAAPDVISQKGTANNIAKKLFDASNVTGGGTKEYDFINALREIPNIEVLFYINEIFKTGYLYNTSGFNSPTSNGGDVTGGASNRSIFIFPTTGLQGLINKEFAEDSANATSKYDLSDPDGRGAVVKVNANIPDVWCLYYMRTIFRSITGVDFDATIQPLTRAATGDAVKLNSWDNAQQKLGHPGIRLANPSFPMNYLWLSNDREVQRGVLDVLELLDGDYPKKRRLHVVDYDSPIRVSISDIKLTIPATTVAAFNNVDLAQTTLNEINGNMVNGIQAIGLTEFFIPNTNYQLGDMTQIWVNLDFLYRQSLNVQIESQDSKEKNEINLYNYIKSIMSGIQSALGNINNFEIHVDPIDNIARIIDVNYTEATSPTNLTQIQVHNTKSTVRSYSLQSQIFPNQSAMIAIGSQAQGGQLGMQNNTMIDFNINLTDRIIPEKLDGRGVNSNVGQSTWENSLAAIIQVLVFLQTDPSNLTSSSGTVVNLDTVTSKARNALRDIIAYDEATNKTKGRNIIPIKFSFNMDGIGGLVIGDLFTINQDILPSGYKGADLAQTITGISHTISDNDWVTKVEAMNIIL